MASKTFKTSQAPTNKFKGGLDAITNGGLYAVQSGKGRRRHKKRKHGLNEVGGGDTVKNQWHKRTSVVKGVDHHGRAYEHTVTLWGATVLQSSVDSKLSTTVTGVRVVLGDESTYTDAMIACKNAEAVANPQTSKMTHKVSTANNGYMEGLRTNGRRVMRNNCKISNP